VIAVRTLEARLNGVLVGHLTHYPDEKTVFVVDQGYIDYGFGRPVMSLSMARPGDEDATQALLLDDRNKSSLVKAPPFFSNLLPEGGLRARIAAELKVHEDREFDLLMALGRDLPGAIVLTSAETPEHMKHRRGIGLEPLPTVPPKLKFSLGGMQLKFSMLRQGQRYTLPGGDTLGNYIVKPPSNDFVALPMVEAATMAVARLAGLNVPEVLLVWPEQIDGLPNMSGFRPNEPFYAIKRFDRPDDGGRRHVEDFAQVFNLRTNQKYRHANYEQIGRTLLLYAGGLEDLREMARRLVLNVLMGNSDAHVKNWSLLYDTPVRPRLSPAYDLVSTVAYTQNDTSIALNMGETRAFASITLKTFDVFLRRVGVLDRVRQDLMQTVMATGRVILSVWEAEFSKAGVPNQMASRLAAHQKNLPLADELE